MRPLMLLVGLVLAGCSGSPARNAPKKNTRVPCREVPLEVHLRAGKQINLNAEGQPTPLEVRVLLLKDREKWEGLDFRTVWRGAKAELGDALVQEVSLTVFPGRDKVHQINAPLTVAYVAIVGLFRQPASSAWRQLFDIRGPAKRCRNGRPKIHIRVAIKNNRVLGFDPALEIPP